jgi:putative pyruvate formate lyase activating enzyme
MEFATGAICLHAGEEPAVSGKNGIVNIFFNRCNLQCRFCQNYQISRPCPEEETIFPNARALLAEVERFWAQGIRRMGLVSPSHVIPQVLSLIETAHALNWEPIFVYNSNGYDGLAALRSLKSKIHIYLPDFKYAEDTLAQAYSGVSGYSLAASRALEEMVRQVGVDLPSHQDGGASRGLIVRHLVLPGQVENSKAVLRRIVDICSNRVHISLMAQYHPTAEVIGDPCLGRPLKPEEYNEVLEECDRLGFENGWIQELVSAEHYQPDFSKDHPFEG